jgi:hypothetical protein
MPPISTKALSKYLGGDGPRVVTDLDVAGPTF